MSKPKATDKFQLVTDKLLALIEQGVKPWTKPWYATSYQNLLTGHQYQGINPLLCTIDMILYQYEHPFFVGFYQAKDNGWKIIKGSKSTWIRWGGSNVKETENPETGEIEKQYFNAFKWQNVFNVACIDDSESNIKISDRIKSLTVSVIPKTEFRIEEAEAFIGEHKPNTQFGGDVACYHQATDTIRLPHYQSFSSAIAYYATYLHELVHWTGHESRCGRPLNNKFGTEGYAFEELIAEMGAAIVCNHLGIDSNLENHASYLNGWLRILKDDKKAFFQAAQKALSVADYLTQKTVD